MMEEVSITVAYDAHVINQICDEDIFANLVADSRPKPAVPTKKLKKFEKEYQAFRESQLQQEDPIDRYQACIEICGEHGMPHTAQGGEKETHLHSYDFIFG
ncbi:uncharacterized protein rabgap1l isoform X6 [Clarias gariepinus]|uniref:uncharacterized protein rabgap1l isoform X6 n=1 Tax=Clarias gariepinus TaxID=13013 RepID=UPI00234D00EF|nr:uncharacterized protein rabgap1l isoform X6 [Clarias gariepinus]